MNIENVSLDQLMRHYYLDKALCRDYFHNYVHSYANMFEPIRLQVRSVLEIGIGVKHMPDVKEYESGNSLRCWRDYFPNANIYGVDIDETTNMGDEDRIFTYTGDQYSAGDLQHVIDSKKEPYFDIIIDDGSHIMVHQVFSFEVLSPHLRNDGGMYIIEDVAPQYHQGFKDLSVFSEETRDIIRKNFHVEYIDTTQERGRVDDFLVVFRRL